jgi:hypothetical protein
MNELKENKKLQKIWQKMQQISSCPPLWLTRSTEYGVIKGD